MLGFHVGKLNTKTSLTDSIDHWKSELKEMNCCQIYTFGPKTQNENKYDLQELQKIAKKTNIYIHSTYPTSFKFWPHVIEQLKNADTVGASGIIIHIPKELPTKIAHYSEVMLKHIKKAKIIWEMRALKAAQDSYESPTKLIALVDEMKKLKISPTRVGICIDTAHINAGGAKITTKKDAQTYIEQIEPIADWISLLHLNGNQYDAKERAGDKHTTPLGALDKVWPGLELSKSGCLVFYKWFRDHNKDTILELDFNKESLDLFQQLNNI